MRRHFKKSPSKNKIYFELLTNKIISMEIDISLTNDSSLRGLLKGRLDDLKHELQMLIRRMRHKNKKND